MSIDDLQEVGEEEAQVCLAGHRFILKVKHSRIPGYRMGEYFCQGFVPISNAQFSNISPPSIRT